MEHTVKSYEEELALLDKKIAQMGGLAEHNLGTLQRLLHNDALSQSLTQKGAMYLVECSLQTANTPSGFRWTTERGSLQPVTTGMLAEGRIIVDEQRPITLVIPMLRTSLGL